MDINCRRMIDHFDYKSKYKFLHRKITDMNATDRDWLWFAELKIKKIAFRTKCFTMHWACVLKFPFNFIIVLCGTVKTSLAYTQNIYIAKYNAVSTSNVQVTIIGNDDAIWKFFLSFFGFRTRVLRMNSQWIMLAAPLSTLSIISNLWFKYFAKCWYYELTSHLSTWIGCKWWNVPLKKCSSILRTIFPIRKAPKVIPSGTIRKPLFIR